MNAEDKLAAVKDVLAKYAHDVAGRCWNLFHELSAIVADDVEKAIEQVAEDAVKKVEQAV